jgi:DNA-binding GntR family transcriptional regulator
MLPSVNPDPDVTADISAGLGTATNLDRQLGPGALAGVGSTSGLPLAERAYVALRDMIVTLQLAPGSPLEEAIGVQLGIGRTPLREAIKRLAAESLVVIYPRRGTFVADVNLTDHSLISDVRRQLEGHAAHRAAERATDEDRQRLQALARIVRAHPGGRDQGMQLDTLIHREVYRCAHNRFLEANLSQYYNLSLRIWYLFLDRLPEVDHAAEHLPMIDAIIAGQPDIALEYAIRHVMHFEQSVNDAL